MDTGCNLEDWQDQRMIGMDGERKSDNSKLSARLDDDINIYIYIYVYIYTYIYIYIYIYI